MRNYHHIVIDHSIIYLHRNTLDCWPVLFWKSITVRETRLYVFVFFSYVGFLYMGEKRTPWNDRSYSVAFQIHWRTLNVTLKIWEASQSEFDRPLCGSPVSGWAVEGFAGDFWICLVGSSISAQFEPLRSMRWSEDVMVEMFFVLLRLSEAFLPHWRLSCSVISTWYSNSIAERKMLKKRKDVTLFTPTSVQLTESFLSPFPASETLQLHQDKMERSSRIRPVPPTLEDDKLYV